MLGLTRRAKRFRSVSVFVFFLLFALGFSDRALGAEEAAPQWRLDAGYSQSRFSKRDQSDWHEETISLNRALGNGMNAGFFAETSRRYGQDETSLGLTHARPMGAGIIGVFQLSTTPDADFLPRWTASADFDGRVFDWSKAGGGPLVLGLKIKRKNYVTGDVDNLNPGFTQYLARGRVWLAARWINSFERSISKRLDGYSFRGDWQALDQFRLFGGYAFAPEADGSDTVDIRTQFSGAVWDLNGTSSLSFNYAREDRKNSYIRNIFSIGLTRRF